MTPEHLSSSPPAPPRQFWTRSHRTSPPLSTRPGPSLRTAVGKRWPPSLPGDPRRLQAWADLAELADDPIERYAYARVGYHRGLDTLRAAGWRGSGSVRWEHEPNRGFLRSLHSLELAAGAIGETDEEQRCALFLRQLDPAWGPETH